jgi:hypothetical protein
MVENAESTLITCYNTKCSENDVNVIRMK